MQVSVNLYQWQDVFLCTCDKVALIQHMRSLVPSKDWLSDRLTEA